MGGGERTVVVTFAMLEKSRVLRQVHFRSLSMWAKTDAEYKLELPQNPFEYLMCVCTGKPEPSTRAWWENKLRLTFTCFTNPYWTSKQEKSVACGTAFYAQGDAPPLMQVRRTLSSAASNQSYGDGVHTMTFTTIPAGNLVIDANAQTAAVGNNSIMQYYQPGGAFIVPHVGANNITGTGTVYYRERWE
jgi:phage-related protein